MNTKICSKCKCSKDTCEFAKDNRNNDGFNSNCKNCKHLTKQVWQKSNTTRISNYKQKSNYDLPHGRKEEMIAEQSNKCAICPRYFDKTPCTDHDHSVKEFKFVRAQICEHCNKALGHIFDNPEIADSMAAYLRFHAERREAAHAEYYKNLNGDTQ